MIKFLILYPSQVENTISLSVPYRSITVEKTVERLVNNRGLLGKKLKELTYISLNT